MGDDLARIAYLVLLAAAVGSFLIVEFRAKPGQMARQMLAWGLIFIGAVAAVGLWQDVRDRLAPVQRALPGGRIEVPVDASGHAQLTALVNGVPVRFVVDTGASQIALRRRDARRVGVDPDSLAYTGQARTANGLVGTAPVILDSVEIGQIRDEGVPAVVIDAELDRSLLGMSYLRLFSRVSFEGDLLVLER